MRSDAVARRPQQRAKLRPEQLGPRQAQTQAAQSLAAAALLVGDPAAGERRIGRRERQLILVDVERPDGDRARAPCPRACRDRPRTAGPRRRCRRRRWSAGTPIDTGRCPRRRRSARRPGRRETRCSRRAGCARRRRWPPAAAARRRRRPPAGDRRRAARRARASSVVGSTITSLAAAVDHDQLPGLDRVGSRRAGRRPPAPRASARESRCDTCGCRRRSRSRGPCVQSTCAASDGVSSSAISTDDSSSSRSRSRGRRDALPQVHPQPADEIGDVALALAQVRIGDLVEHGAELVEHLLHRPLGVDALLAHDARRRAARASDRRASAAARRRATPARAAPARDARADVEQLLRAIARGSASSRCELVLDARRRDLIAQHLRALNQDDRAAGRRRRATRRCRSGAACVLAESGLRPAPPAPSTASLLVGAVGA